MEVLGIDFGGSGIKGAPVDTGTGELLAPRHRIPTPRPSRPGAVADVIAEIARHFGWQGPVGVGYPGVVRRGTTLTASNVHKGWIGLDAARLISEKTGCPVSVINDADAAGLAEMTFGAGRDHQKGVVIMITIGTGLGTAIFTDGHLVPNCELGHIEIRGKEAERRASDAARKRKNLTWKQWARRFDEYLREMERLFWPDLFILGGGGSKRADRFLRYLTVETEVVPAHLLNEAGIVGAALAGQPDAVQEV